MKLANCRPSSGYKKRQRYNIREQQREKNEEVEEDNGQVLCIFYPLHDQSWISNSILSLKKVAVYRQREKKKT